MRNGLAMDADEIGNTFRSWNRDLLTSYLLEITADIFEAKDNDDRPVVEYILDAAGQKGTGMWTVQAALELGMPLPVITEAVYARSLSSLKELREEAAVELPGVTSTMNGSRESKLVNLRRALLSSNIVAYAEGFSLMQAANREWNWEIPLAGVARIWQEGCIIRSALLQPIARTYREVPRLPNLLLSPFFRQQFGENQKEWRSILSEALHHGIPVPALSAALAYYDALRSRQLPANLIQAQRDYFGAHTYERTDRPRGDYFHNDWKNHSHSS
jgi:6-phosphogluconate dehydrogenase